MEPSSQDNPPSGTDAECPLPEPGPGAPPYAGDSRAEDQEVDVWWGGYAPRTMLPSVVLCGTATLLIGGAALYLWSVRGLPALPVRYALYGLLGILWLLELLLLGYRVIFFSYRLTTHHLFRDHGFHRASDTFIDLAAISTVRVRRGPLERLLGVGRVIVTYQGRESGALVLEGVPVPKRVALKIRNQAEAARRRLQTGS